MSPAWAWLVIGIEVLASVVGYDLWAIWTGHHTLSRQMHDWVFHPSVGQFVIGGGAGLLAWFVYHIATYHPHG